MKIQKACMICESAFAKFTCQRCGRLVCESHFNAMKKVCTGCSL